MCNADVRVRYHAGWGGFLVKVVGRLDRGTERVVERWSFNCSSVLEIFRQWTPRQLQLSDLSGQL